MIPVPPGPELPPEPPGWQSYSVPAQQGEFLGRILDPVRAKALQKAITYVNINGTESEDPVGEVVAIAERFEVYLDPEVE